MAYEYVPRAAWDINPVPMSKYSHTNFGSLAVIHHTAGKTDAGLVLEGKPGPKWYQLVNRGVANLKIRRAVKAYEKKKSNVRQREVAAMRSWKLYHQSKGWTDLGYHLVIFPSGHVYEGRPWNTWGAHAINGNDKPGISFAGNFDVQSPTKQALYAFNVEKQNRKITSLVGHYKVPGNWTACPGKNLKKALNI